MKYYIEFPVRIDNEKAQGIPRPLIYREGSDCAGEFVIPNPYDKILLEKKVETARARYDALWDAKTHVDVQFKAAKLSLVAAIEELQNYKQLRMF